MGRQGALECDIDLISPVKNCLRAGLHSLCLAVLGLTFLGDQTGVASEFDEAQKRFLSGDYEASIQAAQKVVKVEPDDEEFQLLLSQSLLAVGKVAEARSAITNALAHDSRSIRLRWQARDVFRRNGLNAQAEKMVEEIAQRINSQPWANRDARSLVVAGQTALLLSNDPKKILNKIFDLAQKSDPKVREVYLAAGNLAVEKHDYALAAKKFEAGLKQLPDDPDLHCGLAQAYAPSDQSRMLESLEAALQKNSNHVASLLLLADYRIDAEEYAEAAKVLDRIKQVNPWEPQAWAYRAVVAHLENRGEEEKSARQSALKIWTNNPEVDHLIGAKLSQKYRFSEGADRQKQALKFDRDYLPAKAQLAQDLLRLGEETEGWQLAEDVQKADAYDVQSYNLANLHDVIGKFATLSNQDFVVRMSRHEAAIYGQRALALLSRARSNLCGKYGLEVKRPTIVEIFPEQKDFAVRTFGMPGNLGYLGVCFGSVVTANSPASHSGKPINWEAVLWHEFCHVVTLQKTRNKMPRWLSEGISVYEELQANPAWGQRMNPRYREMVLGKDLTPVSKLSGAFLSPKSEMHLQFAYYESALVVEFLVERFGIENLKSILSDLGEGIEINEAIAKHTAPMAKIEAEFATFARDKAKKLAPTLDFEKPEFAKANPTNSLVRRFGLGGAPRGGSHEQWDEWARDHPTNFWVLTRRAAEFVEAKDWKQAKPVLQKLVDGYPDSSGPDSAYGMLAKVHRELGETNEERQVLAQWAEKDDEADDAYLRLMEVAAAEEDWPAVAQNAQRYLAVDPLVIVPYRWLARSAENIGEEQTAIEAYRAMLQLEAPDSSEIHFNLARLLHRKQDPAAKRHILQALEEAPRYREGLKMLLELEGGPGS